MNSIESALIALAPIIADLINLATGPAYDAEAERQVMLKATRAIYEYRIKQLTSGGTP